MYAPLSPRVSGGAGLGRHSTPAPQPGVNADQAKNGDASPPTALQPEGINPPPAPPSNPVDQGPVSQPAGATSTGIGDAAMVEQTEGGHAQEQPVIPPAQRPVAIKPDFDTIPAELKLLRNWLVWKYVPPHRQGAKWRKVPFQPNRKTASTTDRSTWSTFDECVAAYAGAGFDGVGFVFDGEIGADGLTYCGIDLDHCFEDKQVQSLAKTRINLLNTYTEISVSRTGAHCIARAAPMDRIVKYDGVEIYTTARYFTVTGRGSGVIRAAPTEIRALADEVRAKEAADKQGQSVRSDHGWVHHEPGEANGWFDRLTPELKDQALDHALEVIATRTKYLEIEDNGGNNDTYYRLLQSCARSGAPSAEDLWVKWASKAHNADDEDALREEFHRCVDTPVLKGLPK
jgi:hypothetical protein